jgi:hypothetical protein
MVSLKFFFTLATTLFESSVGLGLLGLLANQVHRCTIALEAVARHHFGSVQSGVFFGLIVAVLVELFVVYSSHFGVIGCNCWACASNVDVDERTVLVSLAAMLTRTGMVLDAAAMALGESRNGSELMFELESLIDWRVGDSINDGGNGCRDCPSRISTRNESGATMLGSTGERDPHKGGVLG